MSQPIKQPNARAHRGDFMAPETRSRVMSRIRGRDTKPERDTLALLRSVGIDPEPQARDLPGKPDFVLREHGVAIFVDGSFWHGWRFPAWKHKLSEKWEAKIEATRKRDRRNHARLRRAGWTVIRLWDFQLEKNPEHCVRRVLDALEVGTSVSDPDQSTDGGASN